MLSIIFRFVFYQVTILNEFIHYYLVSVMIDNTAKVLVVTVITVMHNKYFNLCFISLVPLNGGADVF